MCAWYCSLSISNISTMVRTQRIYRIQQCILDLKVGLHNTMSKRKVLLGLTMEQWRHESKKMCTVLWTYFKIPEMCITQSC